jgi:hypothetical protein
LSRRQTTTPDARVLFIRRNDLARTIAAKSCLRVIGNCSPPLAKISDFSGRFEQARQHSGNNGESNREQNEPVEMVRYVKVRKREPRRDFDKGVSNYRDCKQSVADAADVQKVHLQADMVTASVQISYKSYA